jgi:hypothetical protein
VDREGRYRFKAWERPPVGDPTTGDTVFEDDFFFQPTGRSDRDRGAPRGAAPPTPPGIQVAYHGGSTGLS